MPTTIAPITTQDYTRFIVTPHERKRVAQPPDYTDVIEVETPYIELEVGQIRGLDGDERVVFSRSENLTPAEAVQLADALRSAAEDLAR